MESDTSSSGEQARYEIRSLVGSGGAGKVYKAWDCALRRFVAIKRFGLEHGAPTSEDERAWREAMTLASIQHPNILTVFDFGMDEDGPYVITEFLEGETLDAVAEREVFARKSFRELVRQTLEGLIAAHRIGLIHRDLKPQNIMVMQLPSGALQFKILDFGLAKILQEPQVQTMLDNRSVVGSIFYITPEQLSRRPVDERSDLYAMGCVYYYALTAAHPFGGESIAEIIASHVQHRVVPLHQKRSDLQPALCDWVMKLMSRLPEHRYQNAAEALTEFAKIPVGKTILISSKSAPLRLPEELGPKTQGAGEPSPARGTPGGKSYAPVIAGVVVLVLLLATLGIWGLRAGRKSAPPPAPAPVVMPEPVKPRPAKAARAEGASEFRITAEVVSAGAFDALRRRVGGDVALRGRVSGVRSRGEEMLIDFEEAGDRSVSLAFALSAATRVEDLQRARRYVNQIVCVQGRLEERDGAMIVRGRDLRQLDVLPPL